MAASFDWIEQRSRIGQAHQSTEARRERARPYSHCARCYCSFEGEYLS
jgi:hypothetical protein